MDIKIKTMKKLMEADFRIVKEFYIHDYVYFIEIKWFKMFGKQFWWRIESNGLSDWYEYSLEKAKESIKKYIDSYNKSKKSWICEVSGQ